jgi:cation diffusion facilitator CzcD-associated flavoprotein CzcO
MRSRSSHKSPVVVIGAGPHGLSSAAHLRAAGVPTLVFGDPLAFWRQGMPTGMLLRSPARASSISDPTGELSLDRWNEQTGKARSDAMALEDFIDYGMWFQALAVPDLDGRLVATVRRSGSEFQVTLSDGETLAASRVVVAAGLEPFAHIPPVFGDLGDSLVYHSSASTSFDAFAGLAVAVIGCGQSALESAALLHEAGSEVELVARSERIMWLNFGWRGSGEGSPLPPPRAPSSASSTGASSWRERKGLYWHGAPTEVGGRFSSWIGAAPDLLRHLPRSVRAPLTYRCIRPAGADWLPDRLRGVEFTLGRAVSSAREHEGRVVLELDDSTRRVVDRVLVGTGYRIDVRRYPFLAPELAAELHVRDGSPLLGRGLESSVPGLHFVGAPAAESFGPVMRFVVGTAYTGRALTEHLLGRRLPAFRWAF